MKNSNSSKNSRPQQSVDYIIVGLGIAGMCFAEQLRKQNKTFLVVADQSQQSSRVAGGLYNPIILKRFTLAWNAREHMTLAMRFYEELYKYLGSNFQYPMPIYRRFNSIEEQNQWSLALDKPGLDHFLARKIIPNSNTHLDVPHQMGEVKFTGRIDTRTTLKAYENQLQENNQLVAAKFIYDSLELAGASVGYQSINAKHIVFCEGFGMLQNPWFQHLPLVGNKGEYLIISCPDVQLDYAFKSSIFIIPMGNDLYKVGATYSTKDTTQVPTEQARINLIDKLNKVLLAPYEIVNQVAGIRPTVKDRKPLIGTHPELSNLHLLNGLGSRGVMTGPTMARQLFNAIENDKELDSEVDLKRFWN